MTRAASIRGLPYHSECEACVVCSVSGRGQDLLPMLEKQAGPVVALERYWRDCRGRRKTVSMVMWRGTGLRNTATCRPPLHSDPGCRISSESLVTLVANAFPPMISVDYLAAPVSRRRFRVKL